MKYFWSDLHLGHANIINYCARPFANVDEMTVAYAAAWDSVVRDNDEIFILGDLGFNLRYVESFLAARPGRKSVAWGNHDPTVAFARSFG